MQSSPDLIRATTTGSASTQGRAGAGVADGSSDGEGGGGSASGRSGGGGGGGMPPPLPDRPSLIFERADLHAIRESNASSLR